MEIIRITNNHKTSILWELEQATFQIYVCVAWLTDYEVFNLLCSKAINGLKVCLVLRDETNDEQQINLNSGINWNQLIDMGGRVVFANETIISFV